MRRAGPILVVLAALFAVCASVPTIGSAATQPVVSNSACFSTAFIVRPHRIGISCDSTLLLRGIRWRNWGASTATGQGIARTQGCSPDCAEGTVRLLRVDVRVGRLVRCGGRMVYSRLSYLLQGRPLPGFSRHYSTPMITTDEDGERSCAAGSSSSAGR